MYTIDLGGWTLDVPAMMHIAYTPDFGSIDNSTPIFVHFRFLASPSTLTVYDAFTDHA